MRQFIRHAWQRAWANTITWPLLPLLILQGKQTRKRTPRLPPAAHGHVQHLIPGQLPLINLLMLGESTAAGVGVQHIDEALMGQIAQHLHGLTQRAIKWSVIGKNGATASSIRRELLPQVKPLPVDIIFLTLGVNDTVRLRSSQRFARDLSALIMATRASFGHTPIILTGVPDMGNMPVLPFPLRSVLGSRAKMLAHSSQQLATRCIDVYYHTTPLPNGAVLACDRYHPNALGYAAWGKSLAQLLIEQDLIHKEHS